LFVRIITSSTRHRRSGPLAVSNGAERDKSESNASVIGIQYTTSYHEF
jgi:hypothetical protein